MISKMEAEAEVKFYIPARGMPEHDGTKQAAICKFVQEKRPLLIL